VFRGADRNQHIQSTPAVLAKPSIASLEVRDVILRPNIASIEVIRQDVVSVMKGFFGLCLQSPG
jgi:hypothetical protein